MTAGKTLHRMAPHDLSIWTEPSRLSGWDGFGYPAITMLANAVHAWFPGCFSRRQGRCQSCLRFSLLSR